MTYKMGCLYLSFALSLMACGQVSYRRPGIVLQRTGVADAGDVGVQPVDAARVDTSVPDAGPAVGREDATVATGTAACGDALETAQLELTNVLRRQAGAPDLRCDLALLEAARAHSRDMCRRRFFSHTNPDQQDAAVRLQRLGFRGLVGENIAAGDSTAQGVTTSWRNSPGHLRSMLNPSFRRLGVGHVACPGTTAGHLWTQDFSD